MRKTLFYILFLLLSLRLYPQTQMDTSSLRVFTDRSLYLAGESVKVVVGFDSVPKTKLVFVDIISSDNSWVGGSKYMISKPVTLIDFQLPNELISGIYLIRVYEDINKKSSGEIRRIALKIVNPYNPKTMGGNLLAGSSAPRSFAPRQVVEKLIVKEKIAGDSLFISFDSAQITDIKTITLFITPDFVAQRIPFEVRQTPKPKPVVYKEEGLILSGNLHHRASGKPMINQNIHLSIPDLKNVFFAKTDSLGRFHFNLSYSSGQHSIYINVDDTLPGGEAVIEVNSDFLPAEVFAAPVFSLDSLEKAIVLGWVQRREISELFKNMPEEKTEKFPFYGHADRSIVLDDYVGLFTLEDYFKEVPGNVVTRKSKGKTTLRLAGTNPQLQFMEPLVMIDYIPVYDLDKILQLNINQIQRYEIVNELYVRDNRVFGGLLNIITRRGDFAGYKFPASAKFVPFTLLSDLNPVPTTYQAQTPDFGAAATLIRSQRANQKTLNWAFPLPETKGPYVLKMVYTSDSGHVFMEKTVLLNNSIHGKR